MPVDVTPLPSIIAGTTRLLENMMLSLSVSSDQDSSYSKYYRSMPYYSYHYAMSLIPNNFHLLTQISNCRASISTSPPLMKNTDKST